MWLNRCAYVACRPTTHDYAVRAAVELAAAGQGPVKGDRIAEAQGIPLKFLENILAELRHAGLVQSQRGAEGGYWLARPADQVTVADVIRVVDGPLANVRGARLVAGTLPSPVRELTDAPDAWVSR
jgi:Rrf2 family protein